MSEFRMIPSTVDDINDFTIEREPDHTYRMLFDKNRVSGYNADGLEAVRQSAINILLTEQYIYVIYGWDYGIQTADLFGMPYGYVEAEYRRRSREALLRDDRITDTRDYVFEWNGGDCHVTFTIVSIFGNFIENVGVFNYA